MRGGTPDYWNDETKATVPCYDPANGQNTGKFCGNRRSDRPFPTLVVVPPQGTFTSRNGSGETVGVAKAQNRCVNVKDKGAKGDGTTNDTAAIQAAIDKAGGTGGTVLVPKGTYMVDAVAENRLSLRAK